MNAHLFGEAIARAEKARQPKGINLESRIKALMYEADYLEYSDQDWKAIMMNVLRSYEDQPVSDEEIRNEIDIFYNA